MTKLNPLIRRAKSELAAYVSGVRGFTDRLGRPGEFPSTPLRSKPEDTYVRNMLAVGILGRIMRRDFLNTRRRLIVLPDCLKNYGDWECCKSDEGNASVCTQCTPECIVYETTERFGNSHVSIVLEPEDMNGYFAESREKHGAVGIVGVACALTMLSGFAKTIKHKHPTQGVFLNYSSCAHHWADPPYNTCFSLRRMAWVLNGDEASITDETQNRGETYSLEKSSLSPDDFYRRLDRLSDIFEKEYLSRFISASPDADIYELCALVQKAIVPDLITRDSA